MSTVVTTWTTARIPSPTPAVRKVQEKKSHRRDRLDIPFWKTYFSDRQS